MRIISLALIVLLAMTASAEMLEAVSNPGAIGIDVKEATQNFFWNDETLILENKGFRVCFKMHNSPNYARSMRMHAKWTKERKREASLSKRMATRRNSLSLRKKVSTRWRSLYSHQSTGQGSEIFDVGGIQ